MASVHVYVVSYVVLMFKFFSVTVGYMFSFGAWLRRLAVFVAVRRLVRKFLQNDRLKAVVPHSVHFRFQRAAVGKFGIC